MLQASDFWRLISEGAHIYVCGDTKAMAKDVHHILLSIFQSKGGVTGNKTVVIGWMVPFGRALCK